VKIEVTVGWGDLFNTAYDVPLIDKEATLRQFSKGLERCLSVIRIEGVYVSSLIVCTTEDIVGSIDVEGEDDQLKDKLYRHILGIKDIWRACGDWLVYKEGE